MNITDPIYSDEDKAREHLEKLSWPHGPVCPHCGNVDPERITRLKGKSTRPGVFKCKECRKPFSVTVGTVMERSKIPLGKWLAAMHLMTASKRRACQPINSPGCSASPTRPDGSLRIVCVKA